MGGGRKGRQPRVGVTVRWVHRDQEEEEGAGGGGEVSEARGWVGWIKRKKYGTKLPARRDPAGEGQTAA